MTTARGNFTAGDRRPGPAGRWPRRPGRAGPSSLAPLSKASPAASSRVCAEQPVVAEAARRVERGVAAGDHQAEEGEGGRAPRRGRRPAGAPRGGSRRRAACPRRARAPWPPARRPAAPPPAPGPLVTAMASSSASVAAGRRSASSHHRHHLHDVVAAGQLRHHAAPAAVDLDLGGDHVGEHAPAVLHHRGGGLVAAGLDAEDFHGGALCTAQGQGRKRSSSARTRAACRPSGSAAR